MSSPKSTGKPVSERVAPRDEQTICVECGFCCDGTLFLYAHLNPGERGHLPEKIERESYSKEGRDFFRLPCGYFDRKCTIYDQKKADICFDFRCQLLKDFSAGNISRGDALQVVREAKRMRDELFEEWSKISGNTIDVNFMSVLRDLGKTGKADQGGEVVVPRAEMFVVRCNIFEALLIKHFRSAGEFEKLMIPEKEKNIDQS